MKKIIQILNNFTKVSLADIDPVNWMDRVDTKFAFSFSLLPDFLQTMALNYNVLNVNDQLVLSYETLYYDTDNFSMYIGHHNAVPNRYKVRQRTYLESNTRFLEVKLKNNKGRTIKERMPQDVNQANWRNEENHFIQTKTPYSPHLLSPKILINYSRITFVDSNFNEKVTVDFDLKFSNNENSQSFNNLVIVEVKQANKTKTPAVAFLKDLNIKPIALSKYCLGVNFLYPHLKKNNFKEKLITLTKIINDASISHLTGI